MPIRFYDIDSTGFRESLDVPMRFPAGEQHITDREEEYIQLSPTCFFFLTGADAEDYLSAAMWTDLQHQRGRKVAGLIPYLPGARQDRGKPFGARIYADMINIIDADQVICFDPHSPIITKLLWNLTIVDSTEPLLKGLSDHALTLTGVIAPDKGARDRAARIAEALNLPLYQAEKNRNPHTGFLSDFACEPIPEGEGRRLIVPDDICDGGRTFVGLANATGLNPEELVLWVSHGVFSGKNGSLLSGRYDHIFTTDSHPGHRNPDVGAWVVRILPYLYKEISL